MAGVPGFEPGNGGIKTRCLTAWLYPNLGLKTCAHRERLVRTERLELSRREALEPKSSVSTNSTTSAHCNLVGGYGEIRTCDPSIMSAVL